MYGKFSFTPGGKVEKTPVKELTAQEKDNVARINAYYKAEDQTDDIDYAKKNKDDRKDASDVPGLCGSCMQLRWIKTKLGHRDRYWCANKAVTAMLPDGLLDTGDEIVKCPFYTPRPKPTDMSLKEMFQKALMIEIKEYEPGTDADAKKRGHIYL
jgi:hypothetical protein